MKKVLVALIAAVAVSVTALTSFAQVQHGNGWDHGTGCHNHHYGEGGDSAASMEHNAQTGVHDDYCPHVYHGEHDYDGGSYAHVHKAFTPPQNQPPQNQPPQNQPPQNTQPETTPEPNNGERETSDGSADPCESAVAEADTDDDGEISEAEALVVLRNYFATAGASKEPVLCVLNEYFSNSCNTAVSDADTDGDGEISTLEAAVVANLYFDTVGAPKEPVICVLKQYDSDPCAAAVAESDTDGDGEISEAEAVSAVNDYFDSEDAEDGPVICVLVKYLSGQASQDSS